MIREQVAADVSRAQRDASEMRRAIKVEAAETLASGRAEADELRARARSLLATARLEVADLTHRRDAILGELGGLSGVIEALAVVEASGRRISS